MTAQEIIDVIVKLGALDDAALGKVVKSLVGQASTPIEGSPVPPPPIVRGPVIIKKGITCTCTNCKTVVYKLVDDVLDNMPTDMFRVCFEPALPKEGNMWADAYGNLAVNCPVCQGTYTVWIKGEGAPYDEVEEMGDSSLSQRLPGDEKMWK